MLTRHQWAFIRFINGRLTWKFKSPTFSFNALCVKNLGKAAKKRSLSNWTVGNCSTSAFNDDFLFNSIQTSKSVQNNSFIWHQDLWGHLSNPHPWISLVLWKQGYYSVFNFWRALFFLVLSNLVNLGQLLSTWFNFNQPESNLINLDQF